MGLRFPATLPAYRQPARIAARRSAAGTNGLGYPRHSYGHAGKTRHGKSAECFYRIFSATEPDFPGTTDYFTFTIINGRVEKGSRLRDRVLPQPATDKRDQRYAEPSRTGIGFLSCRPDPG